MLSCPPDLSLQKPIDSRPFRGDRLLMKRLRIRNLARIVSPLVFLFSLGGSPAQVETRPLPQAVLTKSVSLGQKETRQLPQAPLTKSISPAQRSGSSRRTSNVAQSSRPRLVLLIVVDQFRYDYLTRFGDLFGTRGIGRLLREGASWTDANFDHVPTFTAPGHAVFMTGAWPSQTGIVANEWYEQDTGKKVKSITHDSTSVLAGKPAEKGKSPRRLLCSTVGDELRLADNDRSKVIGISAKDRSAILPSGRRANAAYWFSDDNGNMISSSYYFNQLPDWVGRFNSRHLADKWFGAHWDRMLPDE